MSKFHKRVTMMFCDIFISSVSSPGDDDMKIDDTDIVALDDGKARVFFFFRFTDPPDPIFWKLKKKIKEIFFNFIFSFPSDSCQYSTGVQLCFFVLSFLLLSG